MISQPMNPKRVPPLLLFTLGLSVTGLVGGCDSQASTAYRGEPLLTVVGSVEIALESTEGELSPALAFLNREHAEVEIVDVDAQGEFPAVFTVQVYEPPPLGAFAPILSGQGTPTAALAFITAVTASHPEAIQFADYGETSIHATSCDGGPCDCPQT
jgi:hypothetical protein